MPQAGTLVTISAVTKVRRVVAAWDTHDFTRCYDALYAAEEWSVKVDPRTDVLPAIATAWHSTAVHDIVDLAVKQQPYSWPVPQGAASWVAVDTAFYGNVVFEVLDGWSQEWVSRAALQREAQTPIRIVDAHGSLCPAHALRSAFQVSCALLTLRTDPGTAVASTTYMDKLCAEARTKGLLLQATAASVRPQSSAEGQYQLHVGVTGATSVAVLWPGEVTAYKKAWSGRREFQVGSLRRLHTLDLIGSLQQHNPDPDYDKTYVGPAVLHLPDVCKVARHKEWTAVFVTPPKSDGAIRPPILAAVRTSVRSKVLLTFTYNRGWTDVAGFPCSMEAACVSSLRQLQSKPYVRCVKVVEGVVEAVDM